MAATAIPFVKAGILEALEAIQGDLGERVAISADKEPESAKEYVWIYKGKAKRDFKLMGPRPAKVEEEVRISLRVLVVKGSDKAGPSEERALEIAALVEGALRDLELGAPVLFPILIEELEDEQLVLDQKRGCHVLMTAVTKARI
jgi:hypothetical protein